MVVLRETLVLVLSSWLRALLLLVLLHTLRGRHHLQRAVHLAPPSIKGFLVGRPPSSPLLAFLQPPAIGNWELSYHASQMRGHFRHRPSRTVPGVEL